MKSAGPTGEVADLLRLLDEAFNKRSWHGTNLRGSIRGLSAAQADWRAAAGKHSIADIVAHCAYWKYSARRRLRGDRRGSFGLKGSNWFALPDPLADEAWRGSVKLLADEHRALRAAVAALSPKLLDKPAPGGTIQTRMLVRGVAMHDVYHAGQIQLIKGLHKRART